MRYTGMLGTDNPSVGTYDKTKISTFGRVNRTMYGPKAVYGPGLTKFIDVQTNFAGAFPISGVETTTPNGRKFVLSTIASGVGAIALYEIDFTTGEVTPRGRIVINLPSAPSANTTGRFIEVVDTGTTGWKIFIGTVTTITVSHGGIFLINKVDLADFSFSPSPKNFYAALSNDEAAIYKIYDPVAGFAGHAMTNIFGGGYSASLNQLITARGVAGTLQHDGFATNVAPDVQTKTCTAPTVNGSPTFTMAAHGYLANDILVPSANAPTGFTLAVPGTIQAVVYFVRAANLTANTFELSATAGGAAINAGSVTTPSFTRAYGATTTPYVAARKTGSISTGFVGTALLVNGCQIATPTDGANAGVLCYMLSTQSGFYCWPVSTITAGATTIPGSLGVNVLGTSIDYVVPSVTAFRYSETLGKIIYASAAFAFYAKGWTNGGITHAFGTQIATWLENNSSVDAAYFRGFVVAGIEVQSGWIFATINTIGQRGILMMDARSDGSFGHSKLISPVQDLGGVSKARFITTIEQLYEVTDTVSISYRTAASPTDPIFDDEDGGWDSIDVASEFDFAFARYIQVKVEWDILTFLSGIPTQLQDVITGFDLLAEPSMHWAGMATGSTDTSPSHTVYRQIRLYNTTTPTLYHRGIDDAGNIVEYFDTVTHLAQFSHSLNEGVTWLPGIGPDQLYKRLRFTRLSPPGVILTNSLRED